MKMKHLQTTALVALAALVLTACSDDNPWAGVAGKGGLTLRLKTDAGIRDAAPTRAATELDADLIPGTDAFSITLEKGGEAVGSWTSLSKFNESEQAFPIGNYTVRATAGDLRTEGFACPAFSGETTVTILEGESAEAQITATLANCMVSVDFTDAFKSYFPEFSADLASEGSTDKVHVTQAESGTPVFLNPGHVYLYINLFREIGGQKISTTIQPADCATEARHHYHYTLDFNGGNVGETGDDSGEGIKIILDDTFDEEHTVDMDLSDELFTKPAPTLTASGLDDEATNSIVLLEGTRTEQPVSLSVNAPGAIGSARLAVNSETFTPAWGKELDLCAASAAQQSLLAAAGVRCVGFFKNPDRFARIDLSELNLPVGKHEIALFVKDKLNHESEIAMSVEIQPVTIDIEPETCVYGDRTATLLLNYNGSDAENKIKFQAMGDNGGYQDVTATFAEQTRSRAVGIKTYTVTLTLPNACKKNFPIKVFYNGAEFDKDNTITVPVGTIEYEVAVADAFATYAYLQIEPTHAADLAKATSNAEIQLDGTKVSESDLNRDAETGIIRVVNLEPGTSYSVTSTLGDWSAPSLTLTTERAAQLPNSDFTELGAHTSFTGIQVGGKYKVSPVDYTIKSSISAYEPANWASLNAKTAYSGAKNLNTWFVVPSVFTENKSVRIRSVAYDHAGTTPSTSGGAFNTTYYCTNAPGTIASKTAGELFLGSYSYDGTEHRVDGIDFSSRPSKITVSYSYTPINNETALAYIKLVDVSGSVISQTETTLAAASSTTSKTISLPTYPTGKKAVKIMVGFKSSSASDVAINKPSGSALDENQGLGNKTIGANTYHAFAKGSELTIYSVSLGYEYPGQAAAARPARKSTIRSTRR